MEIISKNGGRMMKKFLAGFLTCALLFGGVTAYAGSGLLGAKVSNVYTVNDASGKKLADAPVIDGKAYAPVRAISEATGAKLTVSGKVIIVDSGQISDEEAAKLRTEYSSAKFFLEDYEAGLATAQKIVDEELAKPEDKRIPGRAETWAKVVKETEAKITEIKLKIAELEKKLGITP